MQTSVIIYIVVDSPKYMLRSKHRNALANMHTMAESILISFKVVSDSLNP